VVVAAPYHPVSLRETPLLDEEGKIHK